MPLATSAINRCGFFVLGLTNNFAYIVMLSAAYDLIRRAEQPAESSALTSAAVGHNGRAQQLNSSGLSGAPLVAPASFAAASGQRYCNERSTSAVLLADTLPSLSAKLLYPFLLVSVPSAWKASAVMASSAAAFLLTGLARSEALVYAGVACASLTCGLGEATYLSSAPRYGPSAISGWSMGTGWASLLGAAAYALLRIRLEIHQIMLMFLVVPGSMCAAYFCLIREQQVEREPAAGGKYGSHRERGPAAATKQLAGEQDEQVVPSARDKLRYLPQLASYFVPLLLVYFFEYFINQGLLELIYYPQVAQLLDHAAQYRWFQVVHQLGVMVSRSSLDLFRLRKLWLMALLEGLLALLFLAHVAKVVHIASFYLTLTIIAFEGLLGGFTYANTFARMQLELAAKWREFAISTVTIAETLGIVLAGALAMRTYNYLCSFYL